MDYGLVGHVSVSFAID